MSTQKTDTIATFIGFDPMLKPLGKNAGGGFSFSIEIPESEYENVKELNNPSLKSFNLRVDITPEQ